MGSLEEPTKDSNGHVGVDKEIAAVVRAMRRAVDAKVGLDCSFAERERATLEIGNEAQRRLLEEELRSIAAAHGKDLLIDDLSYREFRPGSEDYASLCGPLHISRPTYRQVGVRNGPTVVPLELQAGLMEGATPAMGYRVALGYAKDHSRGLEEDLQADHRSPPSRTKLEKMSKRIGAAVKLHAIRIEASLRQSERLPDDATGVSIGLDRTSVPMEEERPVDAPPKTGRKRRTKPYLRTPPAPIDVNYRMAYMGTTGITDQYGDVLVARRYAAPPTDGPDDILRRMMADVRNALRRDASLKVSIVQDGAPEMWNLVRPALKMAGVERWIEAIDRYHLNERFGKVLRAIESDAAARKAQLHHWNEELDVDDSTIDRIEKRIRREMSHCSNDDNLAVLQDNATFLANNKDRMRYVLLRKAGLPVGSGVTEGACRSVIGDRTHRASRRWGDEGITAVLAVRSIYCSDRLPRFFTHLQKQYVADVREAEGCEFQVVA
jgi:hypothetical protein